jgi:hypothetical protein
VIATSKKLDVSKVSSGSFNDSYFARVVAEKGADEEAFFANETSVSRSHVTLLHDYSNFFSHIGRYRRL